MDCRGCRRVGNHFVLACDHAYCTKCLGDLARMSLVMTNWLPLQCCNQPILLTSIALVLEPEEFVYYQFQVRKQQEIERSIQQCNRCNQNQRTVKLDVLKCGHAYCPHCIDWINTDCCTIAIVEEEMEATKAIVPVDPESFLRQTRSTTRGLLAQTNVAALSNEKQTKDPVECIGTGAKSKTKTKSNEDDKTMPSCFSCSRVVAINGIRAPCDHLFCIECIRDRCARALKNDEQHSVGLPVRCCNQVLSTTIIRPALTKRMFTKYEGLIEKLRPILVSFLPSVNTSRKRKGAMETTTSKKVKLSSEKMTELPADNTENPIHCVACLDRIQLGNDAFHGPCGHIYCRNCLLIMAKQSLEDRSLVPIRCCSLEFPDDFIAHVLGPKSRNLRKYRQYLADRDWRKSDLKSDQGYAKLVKKMKGKQCPKCGVGVEKISGCSHMVCTCGHHFCWTCETWPCRCGVIF